MHPQRPLPLHRRLNRPLMRSFFCRPAASEAMPPPQAVRRRAIVTRASRSRARLISATNSRRFVAKPRTPHPIPQAAQLFKPKTANAAGSRGKAPRPFSRGFKGDTLFREREYPPLSVQRQALLSPRHQCRSFLCTCAKKRKKETKSPRRDRRGLLAVLCVYF